MSLDKSIKYGKEHRKTYRGSKAIDCTCRNHGGCDWCRENRLIRALKEEEKTNVDLEEYSQDGAIGGAGPSYGQG